MTVFNAACWGVSYISSKVGIDALAAAGVEDAPIVFGALRFGLAAVPLLPWLPRSSALESARASAIVGSLNGLSYAAVFSSHLGRPFWDISRFSGIFFQWVLRAIREEE